MWASALNLLTKDLFGIILLQPGLIIREVSTCRRLVSAFVNRPKSFDAQHLSRLVSFSGLELDPARDFYSHYYERHFIPDEHLRRTLLRARTRVNPLSKLVDRDGNVLVSTFPKDMNLNHDGYEAFVNDYFAQQAA